MPFPAQEWPLVLQQLHVCQLINSWSRFTETLEIPFEIREITPGASTKFQSLSPVWSHLVRSFRLRFSPSLSPCLFSSLYRRTQSSTLARASLWMQWKFVEAITFSERKNTREIPRKEKVKCILKNYRETSKFRFIFWHISPSGFSLVRSESFQSDDYTRV